MTISSLQDLNTYAQTPITYDDVRTAQVVFDRGATVDQVLVTPENADFVSPWGINIETITQPDVALVEYHLDYSAWADPISVTWPYLPAHMTTTRTNNTWIVSGIENSEDWLYARNATVLPPFGFSGFVPHSAEIHFYSDNQDSTKNIAGWDIDITVTQVEYFNVPSPLTYVSNTLYSQLNTCRIAIDPEDFDPVWDLRIYSADLNLTTVDAIEEMFSDGSAAEAAWNNSTNQYVITGDTVSVNEVLDTLDLETRRYADDFYLVFRLANNFTNNLEYQIQTFSSRDMISDPVVVAGLSSTPKYIFGGIANPVSHATTSTTYNLTRDPNPTTLTVTATMNIAAGKIVKANTTMNAEFSWYYPYYLVEMNSQSTMSVTDVWIGELLEYTFTGNATTYYTPVSPKTGEYLLIDWGDDDWIRYESANPPYPNHYYSTAGTRTVRISGIASGHMDFGDVNINSGVLNSITSFGRGLLPTKLSGINGTVTSIPSSLPPTITDLSGLFFNAGTTPASVFDPVSSWDVSNVNNMASAFKPCGNFNSALSSWDVSSVTDMSEMFSGAYAFNQNINSWDVSAVTDMSRMFEAALVFNQPLNTWDVSAVTDMSEMFSGADEFNYNINSWDVSNVTDMTSMFSSANAFNQPLGDWDVTGIPTSFYMTSMFRSTTVFNQDLTTWCVTNIASEPTTFALYSALTNGNKPIWGTCP
tara:strand:- start:8106 stop:10208 length:2103 start_codon:yes stop_codon:yes gene_type:complete